jgi:transketolase
VRKAALKAIHDLARADDRVFYIGSDLGKGTLDELRAECPDRYFMEGVSEATVVGMAAGLALSGKVVFVHTIATFLTRRCFEQVVVDLCVHRVPVRLIGNGGGLVYAPLGPTHQAIEDLAIMRAIPKMTVVAPCDGDEMARAIADSRRIPGPMYIRIARGGEKVVSSPDHQFQIGSAIPLKEGEDVLIVTTGVTAQLALEACQSLSERGISAGVLHMHTVKPLDGAALLARAGRVRAVLTVEEHTIVGGLGSAVSETLAEADPHCRPAFRRIGIPDEFPEEYGNQASLMKALDITPGRIVREALELLERDRVPTNVRR